MNNLFKGNSSWTQLDRYAMLHILKVVISCRQYKRLRALLKDPRHDCVLFANEFQQNCYCPRDKGESQEKWHTR